MSICINQIWHKRQLSSAYRAEELLIHPSQETSAVESMPTWSDHRFVQLFKRVKANRTDRSSWRYLIVIICFIDPCFQKPMILHKNDYHLPQCVNCHPIHHTWLHCQKVPRVRAKVKEWKEARQCNTHNKDVIILLLQKWVLECITDLR